MAYKKAYGACEVSVHHLLEHETLVYEMNGYLPEGDVDAFIDV